MSGPTRILSFIEILDLPDRFFRCHFKTLLLVALPGTFVASLPPLMSQWSLGGMAMLGPADPMSIAAIYAGSAVAGLVTVVTWQAVVRAIVVLMDGATIGVGEAYLFALHPLRAASLLLGACLTLIGCCACVVPGIVVGLFLSMLLPVIAHEWTGLPQSYSRSMTLVGYVPASQGVSGSAALQIIGLGVLYYVLSAALGGFQLVPIILGSMMESLRTVSADALTQGPSMTYLLLTSTGTLIGVFFSAVLLIYISTCLVLLYRNVRLRQEAVDLHRALDERLAALDTRQAREP